MAKRVILLYSILIFIVIGCNKDESVGDPSNDKPYNIEGHWYISGSTVGYLFEDSVRFNYDDNILGYQEYIFKPVQGEENYYSVYWGIKSLVQGEDESDEDYVNRLITRQYTPEELIWSDEWKQGEGRWEIFVEGINIWLPWDGRKYKGFITAKIVKCSKDVLVIASSDSEFPSGLIEPITFNYYYTLKRIK